MSSIPWMLATGFAGWLDINGAGSWADVSGPYDGSTEWPFYIGPDVGVKPNQQIVITPGEQIKRGADIEQGVQLRYRGEPGEDLDVVTSRAQMISDLCYPAGHPRGHVQLGFIKVGTIYHRNEVLLGRDGEGRVEYIQNFACRFRRPVDSPTLGYSLVETNHFVTSPDASIQTIVTMTQAEYDAIVTPDPTQLVVIIP